MKADRMVSILLHLQNGGKVTTKELAEKLEVSERTIVRDMEALNIAGVPIYAERGRNGGWQLAEGFRTDLTGMKAKELFALLISAQPELLSDLGIKPYYEAAFQKLMASSSPMLRNHAELIRQKIHIDGAGWHRTNEECPYLSIVQEAVWSEQKLMIHYPRGEEIIMRTVHPLGLVAKRSVWYMVAEAEGQLRTYRISRIMHAELLDETFSSRADFDLAEYWEQSTVQFKQRLPRYPAKLRLTSSWLERLQQERYVQVLDVESVQGRWIEAEIQFATLEHACEMVLAMGPQAEVFSPVELRKKVIAEAKGIVERYAAMGAN